MTAIKRTFISLNPCDVAKKKLTEIQNNVKKSVSEINPAYLNSIKWDFEDKFHITLFFIGNISEIKLAEVKLKLKSIENELFIGELIFTANKINAFPKLRYPGVLFLDLINEDNKVIELFNKINNSMKDSGIINVKSFHPHITLGRIKKDRKINLTALENMKKVDWNFSVVNFYLMESNLKRSGSEYSVIEKYKI